ncbi:uncharacterized protein [Amphiura filiformis]|uniref:uncharacterized protein n=1 Tax=Amphiura filiformis TaxID=82378 RepID=UPI003B21567A
MRLIKLSHEDLTIFGHDISASDYSFFAKHKDAFRRMFREQGMMFWRRFIVSFKAYTMSYGIIENPLKKTNGRHYHQMVTEAYSYLECQIMRNTTSAPKVFVEDSGILAQSRHLLGGIEAKPYKASKDPFYMKDTREVFRRVFGDPKDGPFLTLRVYIMYPLCMKMGATLCRLLRRWLDAQDGTEDDIYWTHPSVDLFFSFGFHDDISRLRYDIDELRKERGIHNVDIPRPLHLCPRDTLPDELKPPETTSANRADVIASKKEEKRLKKKGKKEEEATTGDGTNTTITGLEMTRGADGTKFKVQFAQGVFHT